MSPFMVYIQNHQFNCTNRADRDQALKCILHFICLGDPLTLSTMYWSSKPKEQSRMMYAVGQTMSFDLLNNQEELCRALQTVAASNRKNDPGHECPGVFVLFSALLNNDLILKHILQHGSTALWQALLHALLSFEFPQFRYNQSIDPLGYVIIFLNQFGCIDHWRPEQWVFAIDNGLCTFIGDKFRNQPIDILAPLYPKETIFFDIPSFLFWDCFKILKAIDSRRGTSLRYRFEKKMMHSVDSDIVDIIFSDSRALSCVPRKRKLCGFPFCQTRMEGKYICKGCRLVRYCCRRHQKRHWKYIHSQQCRRY